MQATATFSDTANRLSAVIADFPRYEDEIGPSEWEALARRWRDAGGTADDFDFAIEAYCLPGFPPEKFAPIERLFGGIAIVAMVIGIAWAIVATVELVVFGRVLGQ